MAWYDEAVFYRIYPIGMTGAPKKNDYGEPVKVVKTETSYEYVKAKKEKQTQKPESSAEKKSP